MFTNAYPTLLLLRIISLTYKCTLLTFTHRGMDTSLPLERKNSSGVSFATKRSLIHAADCGDIQIVAELIHKGKCTFTTIKYHYFPHNIQFSFLSQFLKSKNSEFRLKLHHIYIAYTFVQ